MTTVLAILLLGALGCVCVWALTSSLKSITPAAQAERRRRWANLGRKLFGP